MADENKKPRYKDTRYLGLIIAIVALVVTIIIWLWPIPPPPPSDFSISIDPMLGAIQAGGVIQTTVSVMGISGYDHTVSLSATGQPSGVVTAFVPPFGEAKPSYTSSVTMNVDKNVPASDYTLVIKGTGADGKVHSCSYTLTVKPPVTPTSTPIITPTPTPTPKILFSDDFSDVGSGWVTYDEYDGRVIYKDECLYIKDYTNPEGSMYGESLRYFTDFIIEVETRLVGGTDDNWHIVACRFKDEGNYYDFSISADGYYDITKWVNGNPIVLVELTRSDYIHQGRGATNLIHVECIGSNLSLSVNGHLLRKVTDATFTGGDITLGASSLAGTFTEVAFDNLVVTEP